MWNRGAIAHRVSPRLFGQGFAPPEPNPESAGAKHDGPLAEASWPPRPAAFSNSDTAALNRSLRVGVLVDERRQPTWLVEALREAAPVATFEGLLVPKVPRRPSFSRLLLMGALSLEGWRTAAARSLLRRIDPPFPLVEIAGRNVRQLSWYVERRAIDLVLVACPVSAELKAALAAALPLGLCEIVVEGLAAADHDCPGASSLARACSSLVTEIVQHRGRSTLVVGRAETRIHRSALSVNVEHALRPTRPLLRAALARVRDGWTGGFGAQHPLAAAHSLTAPASARLIAATLRRTVENRFRRRFREQWSIGLLPGSDLGALSGKPTSIRWIEPDPSGFLADPFPIERAGSRFVFVEEYLYGAGKGHISVIVLGPDGAPSRPIKVLESPHHLSFPFVFEREGCFYMVPERSAGNSILLYEAHDFPFDWRECRVLVPDFPGIDPVLHEEGGRIWLFAGHGGDLNQDNNLHLFSASSLEARFVPHRDNPVATGLAGSRMAGALFRHGAALYRPAQNCVTRYGHAVVLNRVEELGDRAFRETPVETLLPDPRSPYPLGLHTLNRGADLTLIDGLRMVGGG